MARIKQLYKATSSGNEDMYPVTEATLVGSDHGTLLDEVPYMVSPDASGSLPDGLIPPAYGLQTGASTRGGGFTLGSSPFLEYAYGIERDITNSSTSCTRIGNMSLHASLPIQSRMCRCLLLDDGSVNYYLSATDSTKKEDGTDAVLDGSDGMVMVEIPAHWRRFEQEGNIMRAWVSEVALPGFHFVPKCYRSAYEASLDRSVSDAPKLASVVNTTAAFRGGNNNADWDGTYRSLLGMPVTNVSLTNFRSYARNRGTAGLNGAGWNCDVYDVQKTCYWLYVIEYANFNCQLAYNAEPTSEGYKQGGLGSGVTTLSGSNWSSYNGYCPFVPCGHTNSLGNKTGVVDYAMPDSEGGVFATVSVPSYRGLENPFGHVCSWTDGCKCNIQSADAGGVSEFFVCTDPAKFQSNDYTDYEKRGELTRKEGYVKIMMIGEYGENMPTAVGASSTTYFADYFYTNIAGSTGQRGVLFGGAATYGADAGFSFVITNYLASATNTAFGSRLCFLPSAEASEWYSPVGVNTTNGSYYNSVSTDLIFTGDRSAEVFFSTGSDVFLSRSQVIFTDLSTTYGIYITVTESNILSVFGASVSVSVPLLASTKYHVVVSVGNTVNIFVNGVKVQTGVSTPYTPALFSLGGRLNFAYFAGVLYYSRLFNYALTEADVEAMWNGGSPDAWVLPSGYSGTGDTYNSDFSEGADGWQVSLTNYVTLTASAGSITLSKEDTSANMIITRVHSPYNPIWVNYFTRIEFTEPLPSSVGSITMRPFNSIIGSNLTISSDRLSASGTCISSTAVPNGGPLLLFNAPGAVTFSISSITIRPAVCTAEYLPSGLSTTSWSPSIGTATLSVYGTPKIESLPLLGDEVIKTDYWASYPANRPSTVSIVFKVGGVTGSNQCIFSNSVVSNRGVYFGVSTTSSFHVGVNGSLYSSSSVSPNSLHCVQIAEDGTSCQFYIDGSRGRLFSSADYTPTTFSLGLRGDGTTPFLGEIISCHVLDYAISEADARALWNEGDPVRSASPLVKFPATSLSGSDFANVVFGPNDVNWAIIGGYYSDYANGFTGRYVRCFSDEDSAGVRRLSVYSTLFAVPVGSRVRLTIKYRSSEQVYWGSYSPGQTLPKNTGAAALATFEFDSPSTGVSVFSGSVLTESGSSYGIPADSFLEVQLVSLEVFGCVSEWRPSGLLGSGLTPAFSKADVVGSSTRSGYYSSTDSSLVFGGDRSIELLFTVNELPGNTVRIFSDSVNLQPSSFVILLSNTGTIVGRIGGSYVYIKSDPVVLGGTYHVVLTISPSGQSGSSYLNGVVIQQITSLPSYNIPVHCSLGGNSISATFPGVIHHCRLFNYALSSDKVSALWNGGNPAGYVVPEEMQGFDLSHSYSYMSPMTLDGWFNYDGTDIPPVIEDGAIKCAFNSPAVTSYKNGIYREFDPFTEGKRIILKFKIKSSVSGNKVNAGLASSSGTSLYAAKLLTLTDDWEEYVIEAYNNFKSPLNSAVFYPGYNLDQTGFYYVKDVEVKEVGCVAEYLPSRAAVDAWYPSIGSAVLSSIQSPRLVGDIPVSVSAWRDTSGYGSDLSIVGHPSMSYVPVPAEDEIVVDSGYFVTDISTAKKIIYLPFMYVPVSVTVYNANSSEITNVSVSVGSSSIYAVFGATVPSGSSVSGFVGCSNASGALLTRPISAGRNSSFTVVVGATGNTTVDGIRVVVRCRYALG